jgi:transposase-like protein
VLIPSCAAAILGGIDVPIAGRDYPRTLREFNVWFVDEAACLDYLARLRWSGGFVCPACGGQRFWRMSKGRNLRCVTCRSDASVTAGTIFADTRLPLATWFATAWYVTGTKHGVSALSLQRVLGLGSYETAWSLLHKLRRAMVRPGRDRLSGEVEVDESYIGGVAFGGKHGRGAERKAVVAIAVEKRGHGMGRIRLGRIPDTSADSLLPFIEEAIEFGSVVSTDGHLGYKPLATTDYIHDRRSVQASGDPGHIAMPRVHRVSSLLKRWLLGTHQGAVRPQQLDHYLDEFTFRFNRRGSNHRGLLFYRLLEQAVQLEHVPLAAIAARSS